MVESMSGDSRSSAWLSVDRSDNDPVSLLGHIAGSLDHAGLISVDRFVDVRLAAGQAVTHGVALVCEALAAHDVPGRILLDHLESLRSRAAMDVVAELIATAPATLQIVVASRSEARLPLALIRSQGGLLELSASDLALNRSEAHALLRLHGVDIGDDLDDLLERTEGWPVGLYLAGLAIKAGTAPRSAGPVGGDDRFLSDYLQREVLDRMSKERQSFMIRTSVLDQLSGPLCDAILETTGSAQELSSLEDDNLLLVPLDRTRNWYRYHHLLHDMLGNELHRRMPDEAAGLHTRAADWYESQQLPEAAIPHAAAADDPDRVARLVATVGRSTYASGRAETVFRWFDWFDESGRSKDYPDLAAIGALAYALGGDAGRAERWAATAFGGLDDTGPLPPLPLLVRALVCRSGISQMTMDAAEAYRQIDGGSEWSAMAAATEGLALLVGGDEEAADRRFAEASVSGRDRGAFPSAIVSLAERGLIAVTRRDWDAVDDFVHRSLVLIGSHGLERYPTSALPFALAARAAVRRGNVEEARKHLASAVAVRPVLSVVLPVLSVQALLEMASAYVELLRPRRRPPGDARCLRHPHAATRPRCSRRQFRRAQGAAVLATHRQGGPFEPHHGGTAGAPAAGDPPVVPGDRGATLRVATHGEDPGDVDLSQAQRLLTQRSGGTFARDRAAQYLTSGSDRWTGVSGPGADHPLGMTPVAARRVMMPNNTARLAEMAVDWRKRSVAHMAGLFEPDKATGTPADRGLFDHGPHPRCVALARIAAALAVGATADTYRTLTQHALAADATVEDIVGTLLAVAPTIGAARVVAAAPLLAESLGYDIAAALEESGEPG